MKITSDISDRRAEPLIASVRYPEARMEAFSARATRRCICRRGRAGMKGHPRRSRLVILRRKGPFLAQINEFESRRICFGRGAGRDIHDQPEYHENEKKSRKQRQREKQDTSHDDSEHKFRHRGDPKERGSGYHNLNRAEKK
jgi:hypothetical protein